MAKRKFELPGINDLSKEQEAARALPKEGQYLVIGGPGTGKTVIALIRARRHQRDGDDYVFLVWNHLLHGFTSGLAGEIESATWEWWFGKVVDELTGYPLPRKEPEPNGYRPIDWAGVAELTNDQSPIADSPYLVIDEGQDMPPEFYRSLVALGFENFFVVADQNQQITDSHSSRADIEAELGLDPTDVTELRSNYRNTTPIAKLAREFYTGDPASPPPELPDVPGVPPLLYSYLDSEAQFRLLCKSIVKRVDDNPQSLVGVIVANNKVRKRYFDALRSVPPSDLDHDLPNIWTFYGEHKPDIPFDEGGILVVNAQACKGLEFDTVVLADIDQHRPYCPWDLDPMKKRFYVMVARAQKRVILLRRQTGNLLEAILPKDPEVLKRERFSSEPRAGGGADRRPERREGQR